MDELAKIHFDHIERAMLAMETVDPADFLLVAEMIFRRYSEQENLVVEATQEQRGEIPCNS